MTDITQQTSCSINVNTSEKPIEPVESHLSDILEISPDPHYNLSPKACIGILNGSKNRGKVLPNILKEALEYTINHNDYYCNSKGIGVDIYNGNITGDIGTTLSAGGSCIDNGSGPKIMQPIVLESNQNHATITGDGISPTLSASMGMGGGYVPMITSPIDSTYTFKADGAVCGDKSFAIVGDHENRTTDMTNLVIFQRKFEDRTFENPDKSPTLEASLGTGGNNGPIVCYTDTIALEGNGQRPSHGGDGYLQTDKSYTLNGTEVHGVAYAMQFVGDRSDPNVGISEEIAYCIPANPMSDRGQSVAYSVGSYNSNAMKSDNPMSGIHESDICRSIDASGGNPSCNQGGIVILEKDTCTLEPGILAREGGHIYEGISGTIRSNAGDNQMSVAYKDSKTRYIVRRLTPLECERLQGYPDNYTNIGSYIDSKGKVKQVSESARYKALGNSISLPNWEWVIKRLSESSEYPMTMGSLFDGIGGFPLLWEKANGKGTCKWASEIEEFPIAVTKKYFCDGNTFGNCNYSDISNINDKIKLNPKSVQKESLW